MQCRCAWMGPAFCRLDVVGAMLIALRTRYAERHAACHQTAQMTQIAPRDSVAKRNSAKTFHLNVQRPMSVRRVVHVSWGAAKHQPAMTNYGMQTKRTWIVEVSPVPPAWTVDVAWWAHTASLESVTRASARSRHASTAYAMEQKSIRIAAASVLHAKVVASASTRRTA